MDKVLEILGPWGIFLGAITGILWWYFSDVVENALSRKRVIGWLRNDTANQRYRQALTRVLDLVDKRLSPHEMQKSDATDWRVAWSVRLLDFNLAIALAYPILALFVAWTVTGAGSIGRLQVLVSSISFPMRFLVTASLFCIAMSIPVVLPKLQGWKRPVGVFAVSSLAVAVPVAFTGAGAVAGAGAGAGAGAVAVVIAGAGVGAVAIPVAVGGAVAGAIAIPGAVAFAGAVAGEWISKRSGLAMAVLFAWAVTGCSVVLAAITFASGFPVRPDGTSNAGIVLFISLFPLFNALADFASSGLTRYWLRKGTSGNLLKMGLRDTIAGALIFLALGFSVIAVIHFVRPQDGRPLFDLAHLFRELRDPETRGNYWWLAAMLFSTLIPTLFHVMIATLSFFTLAPESWRHWIARQLFRGAYNNDAQAAKHGRVALCGTVTLAIFLPAFILYYAFTLHDGILDGAIWIFRGFAVLIGAIPPG
ncbi:hypothetical protein [Breoghania sp.]|uniref:hypothetical protein n=1 Tax=Breoghania sp. TaxID=2065378 RepID=UPI0029CA57E7|nr:hypothetical protein [Breoghania sp.]